MTLRVSAQATSESTPASRARAFYELYLKLNVRGLPDAAQEKMLAPFLNPKLQQLVSTAKREQAKYIKQHPDEKPPWIEGDLFSSLFEGAQSFVIGPVRIKGPRAEVDINLENREGGSIVQWSDTLILQRDESGWRVWDIVFKGDWQFKTGNSLRGVLQIR